MAIKKPVVIHFLNSDEQHNRCGITPSSWWRTRVSRLGTHSTGCGTYLQVSKQIALPGIGVPVRYLAPNAYTQSFIFDTPRRVTPRRDEVTCKQCLKQLEKRR